MNAKESIDSLISHLQGLKAKGQQVIPMDGMLNVLSDHQKAFSAGSAISFEKFMEIQSAYNVAHDQAVADASARLFESVISTGKEAVKALLVINGGGCVALLALMGQLAPRVAGPDLSATFGVPLLGFAIGVAASALLACLAYLGQSAYHVKKPSLARWIRVIGILVAVVSLAGFIFGCWSAFLGFTRMQFVTQGLA